MFERIFRENTQNRKVREAFLHVFPDILLIVNAEGKYLDGLGGSLEDLVTPYENLKGSSLNQRLPPDLAQLFMASITKALRTQQFQIIEYLLTPLAGVERKYEGRFVAMSRKEVLFIIRDVTARAEAQRLLDLKTEALARELRETTRLNSALQILQQTQLAAIFEAQEKVRLEIAQELHDSVGTTLSAAGFHLDMVGQSESLSQDDCKRVNEIADLVRHSAAEVRRASRKLMPSALPELGLVAAMEQHIDRMSALTTANISLHFYLQNDRFPSQIESHLYRIVQEGLANAIKHAQASTIAIQLFEYPDKLILMIEDDGIGFDATTKRAGLGLQNLEARASTLRGLLAIDSSPKNGSTLTVDIPLV